MAGDLDDLYPPAPSGPPPIDPRTAKANPVQPPDLDVILGRAQVPPEDPNLRLKRQLEVDRRNFGDWARYAGQELPLGFGDEIGAGLASQFRGTDYTDELSDWRRRAKRYSDENQAGALGTSAFVSLPAAVPMALMRLPKGAGLLERVLTQAGLGMGYGAVHGVGSGEGDAANRLQHGLHEGLWGGILGGGTSLAPAAVGGARRLLSPLMSGEGTMSRLVEQAGLGNTGQRRILDRIMADDLRPLPGATARPNPLPNTDFAPTPAQLLADPKLRAIEAQALGPEELAALERRQRETVQQAAEPLLPGPRLANAEMDLETARGLVQPSLTGDTPALASIRLHQGLSDLRDRARAQVSTAFDKIDMPNVQLPTQPLKENFKSMIDGFSALAGEKDVLPPKLLKAIDDLGPTTSMEELQRLRSRLLSDARSEDLGSFEKRVYNRAAGEVLEAMGVGLDQMGPGSEILKRAYQKARDLTRNMKETFDNERVGHLFDPDYSPSTAAGEILTGPGSRERVEALMKMAPDNPRVQRAVKDWLGHDLQTTLGDKDGDVAQRAMDRWFKKHEDLFQLQPDLAIDFAKVADAHRLSTDLGRRQDLVSAIQNGDDPAKLLKKYGPDLARLFPDADERKLVEALGQAGKMINLRGAPGVRSKAVSDLQSDENFMRPLTDDSYGLLGKLATLGPVGRFLYKGPKEDVLSGLKDRLRSGNPADFLALQPREKVGPRVLPPSPLTTPAYEYMRDRDRSR